LIVDSLNVSKVLQRLKPLPFSNIIVSYRLDAKDCVESVGLSTSFSSGTIGSSDSFRAGVLSSLVGSARVGQRVTDELGNNANALSRAVVEGFYAITVNNRRRKCSLELTLVSGLEASFLPVIETNAELDFRDSTAAKVTNTTGCPGVSRATGRVRGLGGVTASGRRSRAAGCAGGRGTLCRRCGRGTRVRRTTSRCWCDYIALVVNYSVSSEVLKDE
jgi:hypothetical protein